MASVPARILVVDDEEHLRDIWSDLFGLLDQEILVASNIEDAISLIQSHPIRALITDLRLPDADGLSLLEYVDKQVSYPVDVFVCSGFLGQKFADLDNFNIHRIIPKPFDVKNELAYFKNYLVKGSQ